MAHLARMQRGLIAVGLLGMCLVLCPSGGASYLSPVWQAEVATRAFVGIVACERAGAGYAMMVVVESWKGMTNGSRFSLRADTDALHPRPRLLLTGQRLLLFASPLNHSQPRELPGYAPTSLSRRRADFGVNLHWRSLPVPEAEPGSGSVLGLYDGEPTVAAFRKEVQRFLSQSPADQERETLQAVFMARLPRDRNQPGRPLTTEGRAMALPAAVARTPEEVLAVILRTEQPFPSEALSAGGPATLRTLLQIEPGTGPLPDHVSWSVLRYLCDRHPEVATNQALRPRLSAQDELRRMRSMLQEAIASAGSDATPAGTTWAAAVTGATTPAEVVQALGQAGAGLRSSERRAMASVLTAGGPETLRALEACAPEEFGLGGPLWEHCRASLRLWLGLPGAPRRFTGYDDTSGGPWWLGRADAAQVTAWKEELADTGGGRGSITGHLQSRAFSRLTFHAPHAAAEWLMTLKPGVAFPNGWPEVTSFAGYFADYCPTDRQRWLARLVAAPHPSVRLVAASAVADEDPQIAIPVFQAARELPGEPGDLACLQLARRGDKTAMDRIVRLLEPPPVRGTNLPPRGPVVVWPVADEARALLSNIAATGGLPAPGEQDAASWWRTHRGDTTLHDPWLEAAPPQADRF